MGNHLDDFTEATYRALLTAAAERYRFEPFGTSCETPHALWRHDLDSSVHRALALARIEAEQGVRATYFFLLHGWFYNLLERGVLDRAREIAELGHWMGLHFDPAFYGDLEGEDLEARLDSERRLLEGLLEQPVAAFSFHNPGMGATLSHDADRIAGMTNVYGRELRETYAYVSDSNGYWRHRSLAEVIGAGEERLHVLTHPEWWQRDPMSPRARVQRCIDGRAEFMEMAYDTTLAQTGRANVR